MKLEKVRREYRPVMGEDTAQESRRVKEDLSQPTERGASFLFWGLIFVTVLNLGMIFGALVLFAP